MSTSATEPQAKSDLADGQQTDSFLERAKKLAPLIEAEGDAIEENSDITPAVIEALKANSMFSMMVPKALGGGGLGLAEAMEVVEEVSRADASTGWAFMANSNVCSIAAGFLDSDGVEAMWAKPEKPVIAGLFMPAGTATETANGYLINGRYSFGSGSTNANWIAGGFMVLDDAGKPKTLANGNPAALVAYVPRDEVEFLGNWDVMGLVGTGSYDYAFKNVEVEKKFTMEAFAETPVRDEPFYGLGVLGIAVAGHAGVACGLMKRALQEVLKIVKDKKRLGYDTPVHADPIFRRGFAEADAKYQSVRAYVFDILRKAESDGGITPEELARVRQVAAFAQTVADEVVGFCHIYGGTQSFRNPSALGRAKRDISVATQHALVDPIVMLDVADPIIAGWRAGFEDQS